MESVCIMLGQSPERKNDASGKPFDDFWGPSLKLLNDIKFLNKLRSYDKDNINAAIIKKIRAK